MPSSRRMLTVLGACVAVAAISVPVVALAHGGGASRRKYALAASHARQICRQAGVSLSGQSSDHHGRGHGGLSEAQVQALQTACDKLAAVYTTQRAADSAAFKTWRETVEAARAQLNSVCPPPRRRHHHHRHHGTGATGPTGPSGITGPTGPTGSSAACREALKVYATAVKAASKIYRQAISTATSTLDTALEEFDTTVETVLGSGSMHHHRGTFPTGPTGPSGYEHGHRHHYGPEGPTTPTGPTGPSGATGPSGTTGPTWQTGPQSGYQHQYGGPDEQQGGHHGHR
jgi:hypothetical protein